MSSKQNTLFEELEAKFYKEIFSQNLYAFVVLECAIIMEWSILILKKLNF